MRPRAQQAGVLVQPVGDQLVVYDRGRHRLHVLSRTAALVWRHCDGRNATADLVALVGRELGAPADEAMILLALEQLDEARLLDERLAPAPGEDGISRREMLHWAATMAAGVLLPTVTSCGAPLGPNDAAGTAGALGGTRRNLASETTTTTPFPNTTTTTPFPNTTTTTPFPNTTTTTTAPPSRKVAICHQGRTIMVDESALPAHLEHGDTLGPCP